MARIRTIKPDYWKSEKLALLLPGPDGREARRIFPGLWNLAEDHGVLRGNPSYVRAELCPYDEDITTKDVERWLAMLERGGFLVRFQHEGSAYVWIRGFQKHQRINRPTPTTLPEPSDAAKAWPQARENTLTEDSLSPHGVLTAGREEEREKEVEKEVEGKAAPPSPPTIHFPRVPEKPTTPDEEWTGPDFVAYAQAKRFEVGLAPEKPPNEREVGAWWSALSMAGFVPRDVRLGFVDFGNDPYWLERGLPLKAFLKQWANYTRKREVAHANAG